MTFVGWIIALLSVFAAPKREPSFSLQTDMELAIRRGYGGVVVLLENFDLGVLSGYTLSKIC